MADNEAVLADNDPEPIAPTSSVWVDPRQRVAVFLEAGVSSVGQLGKLQTQLAEAVERQCGGPVAYEALLCSQGALIGYEARIGFLSPEDHAARQVFREAWTKYHADHAAWLKRRREAQRSTPEITANDSTTREMAKRALNRIGSMDSIELREQIVETALETGQFDTWAEVFAGDRNMVRRLRRAFGKDTE